MSEGDTLYLRCDGSNSDPLPTLHWVSPDGETVSDCRQLVIMDITRNMSGMYTCVATLPHSTMTMNTTVSVNVTEGERESVSLLEMFAPIPIVPCDKLDCKSANQGELLLSELLSIQQVLMFYEHSHHKLCVVRTLSAHTMHRNN